MIELYNGTETRRGNTEGPDATQFAKERANPHPKDSPKNSGGGCGKGAKVDVAVLGKDKKWTASCCGKDAWIDCHACCGNGKRPAIGGGKCGTTPATGCFKKGVMLEDGE